MVPWKVASSDATRAVPCCQTTLQRTIVWSKTVTVMYTVVLPTLTKAIRSKNSDHRNQMVLEIFRNSLRIIMPYKRWKISTKYHQPPLYFNFSSKDFVRYFDGIRILQAGIPLQKSNWLLLLCIHCLPKWSLNSTYLVFIYTVSLKYYRVTMTPVSLCTLRLVFLVLNYTYLQNPIWTKMSNFFEHKRIFIQSLITRF